MREPSARIDIFVIEMGVLDSFEKHI